MLKYFSNWWIFTVILFGVVYASLIPFQFQYMPFGEALAQFETTPYLSLGAQSRADWIANILLYMPIGCFLAAVINSAPVSSPLRWFLLCLSWFFTFSIAVGIEFIQLYFPPRTVSINDIVAEGLGLLLGMISWGCFGKYGSRLFNIVRKDSRHAFRAGLILYTALFLIYSLFPFDILVSSDELSWKINSDGWGFFLAKAFWADPLKRTLTLLLEACATIPLGALFLRDRKVKNYNLWTILIYGAVFGVVLETIQFFLVSGTCQGASVLAKAAGVSAGVLLPRSFKGFWFRLERATTSQILIITSLPYVFVTLYLNGMMTNRWVGMQIGLEKLNYTMLIPFYYHYFSSETSAVISVVLHSVLYGLIGLVVYILSRNTPEVTSGGGAAMLAALFALVMEGGKIFIENGLPDFTNVLIAGGSAWSMFKITTHISRWIHLSNHVYVE